MWKQSLLFWTVCGAVLVALATPLHSLKWQGDGYAAARPVGDSFRVTLERLNESFEQAWSAQQLAPAQGADEYTIARRISLALQGTVPALEELRHIEHTRGDVIDAWLQHVLDDGRAHDYLAERFARALVGTKDGPFVLFRRRRFVSWLSEQLQHNRPYDELVREVIDTEGLWTDRPATNFITVTIKNDQTPKQPDASELAARVSRAFLGVRIDCAECHDHPFQPWKQREFQGLAAYFAGTHMTFQGIRDQSASYQVENRKTGKQETIAPVVPYQAELLRDGDLRKGADARAQLAHWVTHRDNLNFSRAIVNRVWALLLGRGLVEPIDDLRNDAIPPALNILAEDFRTHRFDLRRLIRLIVDSRTFRLESRLNDLFDAEQFARHEAAWAVFPLTRLRPEQVALSVVQASRLATVDQQSHILLRFARQVDEADFRKRYGDLGEDELQDPGGTIPQRLLMLNGKLVGEKTRDNPVGNACTQLALLSDNDEQAIEGVYLTILTRRPSAVERIHFQSQLDKSRGNARQHMLADLAWTLFNSTEFSWNH